MQYVISEALLNSTHGLVVPQKSIDSLSRQFLLVRQQEGFPI